MHIDEIDIRKIKDAANVVDVISDFIHLKKKGSEYVSLCPFHADRHIGSFSVNPRKNIYQCFSCGKNGDSIEFLMDYANMTFQDAIRYLGAKYGIEVEGSKDFHPRLCKPHTPPPPLPVLVLPIDYIKLKQDISNDTLCNWIRNLPWNAEQKERVEKVLKTYLVGHSKEGHTIFWQMDEGGKLRTGKMMLYKTDGHRDKESKGNFSWIHTRLQMAKLYDPNKVEYKTTYFGMHLVDFCPDATINIVESEKTALLCSIYYGNQQSNLWIACGGLSMLTKERLMPLIERGRNITLYPDHDSIGKWTAQAAEINYKYLKVNSTFVERNWRPEDGDKADIADILVRLMTDSRACKVQKVQEVIEQFSCSNPFFAQLVDRLGLQPVIPA